jgi:acetolactate synthase-1/2/3 large subunit
MCIQELGTISQYDLDIKIIIINNGWQGMVRQWQESFYGNRFSNSYMKNGMPEFSQVAKAYNLEGYTMDTFEGLKDFVTTNLENREAFLVDVNVIEKENCYPMVAPGRSNSQMLGLEKSTT